MQGANLQNASLADASLQGADLREAQLEGICLKGAFYDENTRFEPNFAPLIRGMKLLAEKAPSCLVSFSTEKINLADRETLIIPGT